VDKASIENEGHMHSQISAYSDRQNKYRSKQGKEGMKTTHEKRKASNGEYLVLHAVDDIYVPEYHHVVRGMVCRRFRNITASIFRIKGPKTVSTRRAMN